MGADGHLARRQLDVPLLGSLLRCVPDPGEILLLRWLDRAPRAVGHIYTLFVVVCGWVLFQLEDMTAVSQYFAAMFGGGAGLVEARDLFYLVSYAAIFVIGAVSATPLGAKVYRSLPPKVKAVAGPALIVACSCWPRPIWSILPTTPSSTGTLGGNREQKGALDRGNRVSGVHLRLLHPQYGPARPRVLRAGKRSLQQRPAFSFDELFSGQYTKDFEAYTTDQFTLRDEWITLKAASELALGKRQNNGMFLCDGGTIIEPYEAPEDGKLEANMEALNKLVANTDADVYFALIPGKSDIWAHMLPQNAPRDSEKAAIDYC